MAASSVSSSSTSHGFAALPEITRSRKTQLVQCSGPQKFSEIGKNEIYEALRKIIGLTQSGSLRSTGFFAYENERSFFATAFHSSHEQTVKIASSFECEGDPLVLDDTKATLCRDHDLQLLDCYSSKPQSFEHIPLAPASYKIAIGTAVFFAGFPLNKYNLIFHKGYISSVEEKDGAIHFTIDGTIVAGHSGSPVVVRTPDKKALYIIGMIKSQSMNFKTELDYLHKHADPNIQTIGTIIKGNLSTGVGRAIDIRVCRDLLSNERIPSVSEQFESTVEDSKSLFQPESTTEESEETEYGDLFPKHSRGKVELKLAIENFEITDEMPVHGTLRFTHVSAETTPNFPVRTINLVIDFLEEIREDHQKRKQFYSKCWGNPGTMYTFGDNNEIHFDIQSPLPDHTNLQMQISTHTIATILLPRTLSSYKQDSKIFEVVKFTMRQFIGMVNKYREDNKARVRKIIVK